MALLTNTIRRNKIIYSIHNQQLLKCFCDKQNFEDKEFRVFDVRNRIKKESTENNKYIRPSLLPPRENQMPTNQDWTSVWPGPRSFHPASVPFPIKQGFDRRDKLPPPGKYANAELMKLPNFLHLTPPAIEKHCKVLLKFCTSWPKQLIDSDDIDKHFPLQIITTEYCHSSPKIRDPKTRIVSFQFKLSHLSLDNHSKDKIQRLLGLRYNNENDVVTLTTDRCPLRRQNYDYNQFLLLALFYESWKNERWEEEKGEEDMEYYNWDGNASMNSYVALKKWYFIKNGQSVATESSPLPSAGLLSYRAAVTELMNKGETTQSLFNYKEAVLKILFQQS